MNSRDLGLTDVELDIRRLATDFVDSEIVPHARRWDREEMVDRDIVKKLASLGFLGLMVPEAYGGVDASMMSYVLMMEELGRGDSSVRGIVSVSLGLVTKSILSHGTDAQKSHWLPQLVSGEALGCFAMTEPGTGSDASSISTRAVRDGDDWLISGSKIFITNGTWAGVALTFARTSENGVTAFLVPCDSPGFTSTPIHGKLGLRGQPTAALDYDEVRVPDSARLGEIDHGLGIALGALSRGRISVAAGAVGVGQAALDVAVRYSTERDQFGKVIASFQLVQELLADSSVDLRASRLLTHHAARMVDAGVGPKEFATDASIAKYHASETAVRVTNNCLQVFGGYGFIDEFPVGKYLRDARVLTLYEGTSQIQKLIIGRDLTGVDSMS